MLKALMRKRDLLKKNELVHRFMIYDVRKNTCEKCRDKFVVFEVRFNANLQYRILESNKSLDSSVYFELYSRFMPKEPHAGRSLSASLNSYLSIFSYNDQPVTELISWAAAHYIQDANICNED